MGKLTALQVKNLKEPGRYGDGKGLHLYVKPTGAKSWVLRIVVNGKRRDFGLGPVDLVSLQEAREKALEGRKMARNGFDPGLEWKKASESIPTFEDAARRYHANVKAGWKNGKHSDQWLSTLVAHAFPVIGKRTVDQIDAPAIQSVLLPIWLTLPETARRVRQRIGAVLDYAHGQGWRATESPMRAVAKGLPKQPKGGGHFEAMPYADVPALMDRLRQGDASVGRYALQFTILTAARSGEVRAATWDEIDWEGEMWSRPASHMKAGEAHSVPLSSAAMDILREMRGLVAGKKGEPIFPGMKGQPLSDVTISKALRVAGGDSATVHGMRSSFKDWCREMCPTVPDDVSEAALAHKIESKTKRAYQRTAFLDQRRELMGKWAEYLNGSSNVIALAERRA